MDPELPGSEKPGAIYEYIENKKDKKKIFETEIFANRKMSGVNINDDENIDELDENIIYDREIYQKFYKDLILSMPAKREILLEKIYTHREGIYIGTVLGVKAKDKNEFIVKLENGMEVIYDKDIIERDKNKDIIQIMEFFSKAKFIKLWLGLRENDGSKEIYIKDYEDLAKISKYRDKIIKYKDQYGLTWYEYLLSAMGYNIFDLNEKDKDIVDKLYIPRVLGLFRVNLPTADSLFNPYTHVLQLTPPSTGKTKFYTSLQGYLRIGYISGIPSRARLVYNAEKNTPGEIFYSEYIVIDEIDKSDTQAFIEFAERANEGIDSGRWSSERGDTEKIKALLRGKRLPRGIIFLGNIGDESESEQIFDEYAETSEIKKIDNARNAGRSLLKEKAKSNKKYRDTIDSLISRMAIVSVVTDRFNINRIKSDRLLNPLAMHELVRIIQNEINRIANNYNKYIDEQKIKQLGQFNDARMEDNAIKLAIKIKALELDKYLNENSEELAVNIVKGTWKWP
jgi:hypothetical protein